MKPDPSDIAALPDSKWLPWLIAALTLFFASLLYPVFKDGAVALLLLVWLSLLISSWTGKTRWLDRWGRRIQARAGLQKGLLMVSSLLLVAGGLELTAQILTRLDVLETDSPMITMLPEGSHDWRLAHITADRYREPDPILFWRPVDHKPYTKQRFRGPVIQPGDSEQTFRIFCYGDSNTDGPTRGGAWAEHLQQLLENTPSENGSYEVVNAGVAGYSSHQGLLRLRQDIERYRPDLILVSFGWNDAADALGVTDRGYRPPATWSVGLQRLLLKYRFFLVAKRWARPSQEPPEIVGPRVSLEEYRENLEAFRQTAAAHDAGIVFLTRPHQHTPAELAQSEMGLLRQIPLYNQTLRAFSRESGALLVDVQRDFEVAGPDFFADEAHFTLEGHRRMAKQLLGALSAAGVL